jgi:hypothetical protein
MTRINTVSELYGEMDKIVSKLKSSGHARLAAILFQRLHEVAWTTGSELLDELATILREAVQGNSENLTPALLQDVTDILSAITRLVRD